MILRKTILIVNLLLLHTVIMAQDIDCVYNNYFYNGCDVTKNDYKENSKMLMSTEHKLSKIEEDEFQSMTSIDRSMVAIKTNFVFWSLGATNLGVEFKLGEHLSLDVPIVYSPYALADTYRFELLASQPELRYWFSEPFKGHMLGLNVVGGWYNIAVGSKERYQDRDGENPAYGVGVSYGYGFSFGKHWGLELNVGLGYMHLDYDIFYNIDNGAKFDSKRKHYWGPTKLGINLVYRFNRR